MASYVCNTNLGNLLVKYSTNSSGKQPRLCLTGSDSSR